MWKDVVYNIEMLSCIFMLLLIAGTLTFAWCLFMWKLIKRDLLDK